MSHLSIIFIMGGRFLRIEVAEGNVGVEKINGITDGGGVMNSGARFEDVGEGRRFKEAGEEEVPLQVGEGEELFGGRHREPKTGDGPSLYKVRKGSKKV